MTVFTLRNGEENHHRYDEISKLHTTLSLMLYVLLFIIENAFPAEA